MGKDCKTKKQAKRKKKIAIMKKKKMKETISTGINPSTFHVNPASNHCATGTIDEGKLFIYVVHYSG